MGARVVVSVLAGMVAVIALCLSVPHFHQDPKGIALPSKEIRPAISPDQVVVYNEFPSGAVTRLGQVRAEMAFRTLDPATKEKLLQEVKVLAAAMGANGVVINMLVPSTGVGQKLTFIGTAIYHPVSSASKTRSFDA